MKEQRDTEYLRYKARKEGFVVRPKYKRIYFRLNKPPEASETALKLIKLGYKPKLIIW